LYNADEAVTIFSYSFSHGTVTWAVTAITLLRGNIKFEVLFAHL